MFVRYTTPITPATETTGTDSAGPPFVSEWLPVTPTATAIVLKDPGGSELGRLSLTGSAPVVSIVTPAAGFVGTGDQVLAWTVQDPDSVIFSSRAQYSSDNGSTWSDLGEISDTSIDVDFDDLPGSSQALIRILVSDGINTGSMTSPSFQVPRKSPQTPEIDEPVSGAYLTATDTIVLSGSAYDVDDGDLHGTALQWTSSQQGALGSGNTLSVSLQPGIHQITLSATDSDGNGVNTSTTITVVNQPPVVALTAGNMPQATIAATPGAGGAPLSTVEYSTDAGVTWTGIPLASLPLTLTFSQPGDLMARAVDAAGLSDTEESSILTPPLAVAVSPAAPVLLAGASQQFNASVTGNSNTAVVWTLAPGVDAPAGARLGDIDPDAGLYFAPDNISGPFTVIVKATSQVDYKTFGAATVSLVLPEAISAPSAPTGPSGGLAGSLYQFSSGGSISNLGHPVQYSFDWGDGSASGWTPTGVTSSFHVWSSPSTYTVFVTARCTIDNTVLSDPSDSVTIVITGESVSPPNIPSGPTSALTNTTYSWTTGNSVSSAGNQVQYRFYWGDGSNSPWLSVGTVASSHSWAGPGTYLVTAQARSAANPSVTSAISAGLQVTVTANETITPPDAPIGPSSGTVGVPNTYNLSGGASSLGNSLRYLVDWGDGTTSGWLASGVTAALHAWSTAGSFNVTVIAADVSDLLLYSVPSAALTVTVQ